MSKVLRSYRSLMRAASLAFKNDAFALKEAHSRIRLEFSKPAEDLSRQLQMARDVAHILRSNVIQGVNESGTTGSPIYKLKIHQDTELGDNDDRFGQTSPSPAGTGCCGGSSSSPSTQQK